MSMALTLVFLALHQLVVAGEAAHLQQQQQTQVVPGAVALTGQLRVVLVIPQAHRHLKATMVEQAPAVEAPVQAVEAQVQ